MKPSSQWVTILFADIAESTRLYDVFGDIKGQALVAACLSLLKEVADENGGLVIKTIGDEVLCTFETPDQAADAARQMHEEVSLDSRLMDAGVHLRIGFYHGEVLFEPGDVFGDAVNVAARMVELAKADQIITAKKTLSMMRRALRHEARIVDRTRVRGKDDIMEIHELIWGKPEQMTMSSSLTEEVIASLTEKRDFLKIRYGDRRIVMDNEMPILTLGRGMNNHLIVDDSLVSRMHVRIDLRHGRFMLIDQSTNGTYLKPLDEPALILRRDEVQLIKRGLIGLGQKVDDNHPLAVRYWIL